MKQNMWQLVWCCEHCRKDQSAGLREKLTFMVKSCSANLVCLKKATKYAEFSSRCSRPPFALLADWREAKPCMQAFEDRAKPLVTIVYCNTAQSYRRAVAWASTLDPELGYIHVLSHISELEPLLAKIADAVQSKSPQYIHDDRRKTFQTQENGEMLLRRFQLQRIDRDNSILDLSMKSTEPLHYNSEACKTQQKDGEERFKNLQHQRIKWGNSIVDMGIMKSTPPSHCKFEAGSPHGSETSADTQLPYGSEASVDTHLLYGSELSIDSQYSVNSEHDWSIFTPVMEPNVIDYLTRECSSQDGLQLLEKLLLSAMPDCYSD